MINNPSETAVSATKAATPIAEIEQLVKAAVSRYCRRVGCTASERADLIQEGLVAGWQAASSHDITKGASLSTWILRRVVGQIRDVFPTLRNHGVTCRPTGVRIYADTIVSHRSDDDNNSDEDSTDCLTEIIDESALSPETEATTEQSIERLRGRMPPRDMELFQMVYRDELSMREIGARLDLSYEAVRLRLQQALARAKRQLRTLH